MAPRATLPQKKNRARCGIKYSLKIFKGDLAPDSEYIDEDLEETVSQLTADVDINEGNEHHLQAALATKAVFIPTPGAIRVVDNYEELYPTNKWVDPVSYLKTTQTCEEACSNALVDHEYTYFMDEIDKKWLDKNNQQARGEGTSAQGARPVSKGKAKSPEIGVPVSISEDEFELVMGLLEKITGQKVAGDRPDFSLYEPYFLQPLSADMFASYVTPSWIPPPALLVRIVRTVYPHWEQRRSMLKGRKLRPSLNFDESDFLNESYICFRRRDNKPVRKTRAGQLANNADKLAQLDQNLSQALDIANALLARENVKQAAAVQSYNVWRARLPLADLLRKFPSLVTKADEERLLDKPRKVKTSRSSLLKVKVLPPSHQGTPSVPAGGQAILPSQRCAAIQQEITKSMQKESQENKDHCQVDVVDDPYQPYPVPRAEKMWVDVPLATPRVLASPMDQPSMRDNHRAVRLRYGRGGRRFLDRRSSHPYLPELRNHRRHADDDDLDEETTRRLHGQWRFDSDSTFCGPAEEENRELVDEYDTRFLSRRLTWATKAEVALVTDASLVVHGHDMRLLPEYFTANAAFVQDIYQKPSLLAHLAEEGIRLARTSTSVSALASPRVNTSAAAVRASTITQKPTPVSTPSPHPRAQAPMRPPPSPTPVQPKMQEKISPQPGSAPVSGSGFSSSTGHVLTRPPAASLPPRMQENISPKPGSAPSSPARPRTYVTVPHSPNSVVPRANGDAVKIGGGGGAQGVTVNVNVNGLPHHSPGHGQSPLQTNGARTAAAPGYVPLSARTDISLKLPSRAPARPSPLATHSTVASPLASSASDSS
ncbi:enhancer of polycomb-like-domain-containing protein [Mycena haematopus]|nr:enhancer of polycomb-like-domain-containing protein [Mycena haematopus]